MSCLRTLVVYISLIWSTTSCSHRYLAISSWLTSVFLIACTISYPIVATSYTKEAPPETKPIAIGTAKSLTAETATPFASLSVYV